MQSAQRQCRHTVGAMEVLAVGSSGGGKAVKHRGVLGYASFSRMYFTGRLRFLSTWLGHL